MDEKGEKCIFIGHSDESKGYRLYKPDTKDFIISRDVIFDELKAWKWSKKDEHGKSKFIKFEEARQEEEDFQIPQSEDSDHEEPDEDFLVSSTTDTSVRKIRSLRDVYDARNVPFLACEPQSFQDAVEEDVWKKAMNEEIRMIEKNKTWQLVDKPKDKEVIGLKWVFKTKLNEDVSIQKQKARLVAKGYTQRPGIDFNVTFALVARMETIRTILALAAQMKLYVYQMDVKSAFLIGELDEEVYIEQPQGYMH